MVPSVVTVKSKRSSLPKDKDLVRDLREWAYRLDVLGERHRISLTGRG